MLRHVPGKTAGRAAEQVSSLFGDGGAHVGKRSDVGEREFPIRPLHEIPRRSNRSPRFRRKIDADENAKRRHHFAILLLRSADAT